MQWPCLMYMKSEALVKFTGSFFLFLELLTMLICTRCFKFFLFVADSKVTFSKLAFEM